MPLPLAPALPEDLGPLADLVNMAYRGARAWQGWTTEAGLLDGPRTDAAQLRADLAAKPGACLLVLRDAAREPPIGCVWIEPAGGGTWFLGMLTVRPDLQDRRLGRTLLDGAEGWARAQGAVIMRMSVLSVRATLIAWYERRGYALTGETQPFPYVDPPRADLVFVFLEKWL